MDRPKLQPPTKKGEFSCPDSEFLSNYPLLAAGLCDLWWSDGKSREPWTLKVSFGTDSVTVTTNDKDSKLVAFTTAPSLEEAFSSIEVALGSGGLAWRRSKY